MQRKKYIADYKHVTEDIVAPVVAKLKENYRVRRVVNNYLDTYVKSNRRDEADAELYSIMTAEFPEMLDALNHTTCSIM